MTIETVEQLEKALLVNAKSRKGKGPAEPIEFEPALWVLQNALDSNAQDPAIAVKIFSALSLLLQDAKPALDNKRILIDLCLKYWRTATTTLAHKCKACLEILLENDQDAVHYFVSCVKTGSLDKFTLLALQFILPRITSSTLEPNFPNLSSKLLEHLAIEHVSQLVARVALLVYSMRLGEPDSFEQYGAVAEEIVNRVVQLPDTQKRTAVIVFVVPLIQRYPELQTSLMASLSQSPSFADTRIMLLQTLYSNGVLKRQDVEDEFLLKCLQHSDGSIRMSAVTILTRGPSHAAKFTSADFKLLKQAYALCIGCSDLEERHKLHGCTKAMLERLRASAYAAARDLEKGKADDKQYLEDAKAFLDFLATLVASNLHSAAPYRLLINCLALLKLFISLDLDKRCSLQLPQAPNAPTTLSWPFQLQIASASFARSLLRLLLSTFNDVKLSAIELLLSFPSPLPGLETPDLWDDALLGPMRQLQGNTRDSEAQSAALLARLYFETGQAPTVFLEGLVDALDERIQQAERDLGMAAEQAPLHGTLASISAILELKSDKVNEPIFLRLLNQVERIFNATAPILTNNVLEGTATDHEEARALAFEDDNLICAAGPRHKVMLSTSWRAVKEAAILMEIVMRTSPRSSRIWTLETVTWVSSLFNNFMLQIRHRGAFESIASSFSHYCALLSSHPDPSFASQPDGLLKDQLNTLLHSSRFSTTRRSAGLPHFVLAILNGTLKTQPHLTDETLTRLLSALEEPVEGDGERQVHASNIVRLLLLDTKLAARVKPQLGRAFLLAIKAFDSPLWVVFCHPRQPLTWFAQSWGIRNSALLLFAALIQRAFGIKRLGLDRTPLGLLKRTKRDEFFLEHPSLLDQLTSQLQLYTQQALVQTETHALTGLYSILLLLSHLRMGSGTSLNVQNYRTDPVLQAVLLCSGSGVWKIRNIAADAAVGLVSDKDSRVLLEELVSTFDSCNENTLHGRLLLTLRLVQYHALQDSQLLELLDVKSSLVLQGSHSPAVKAAVLDLSNEVARHCKAKVPSAIALIQKDPPKGPAQASFVRSATIFLHEEDVSADVFALNLARIEAELTLPNSQASLTAIEAACLDPSTPIDLRISCLERLCSTPQQFPSIVDRSRDLFVKHTSRPLQEVLLPFLFSSANEFSLSQDLQLLKKLSNEKQPETSRLAVAKSLAVRTADWSTWTTESRANYLRLLLTLLQDDDTEVREVSAAAASSALQLEDVSPEVALEAIWNAYTQITRPEDLLMQHVQGLNALAAEASSQSALLFAEERSNVHIDDTLELRLLVAHLKKAPLSPEALGSLAAELEKLLPVIEGALKQSDQSDTDLPLGLGAQPTWWLLAFKGTALSAFNPQVAQARKPLLDRLARVCN